MRSATNGWCRSLAAFVNRTLFVSYTLLQGKLSLYATNRIVSLKASGMSIVKITKEIQEESIQTTRTAVNLFLLRYKRTGCIADAKHSGRKPIRTTIFFVSVNLQSHFYRCHFFLSSFHLTNFHDVNNNENLGRAECSNSMKSVGLLKSLPFDGVMKPLLTVYNGICYE